MSIRQCTKNLLVRPDSHLPILIELLQALRLWGFALGVVLHVGLRADISSGGGVILNLRGCLPSAFPAWWHGTSEVCRREVESRGHWIEVDEPSPAVLYMPGRHCLGRHCSRWLNSWCFCGGKDTKCHNRARQSPRKSGFRAKHSPCIGHHHAVASCFDSASVGFHHHPGPLCLSLTFIGSSTSSYVHKGVPFCTSVRPRFGCILSQRRLTITNNGQDIWAVCSAPQRPRTDMLARDVEGD